MIQAWSGWMRLAADSCRLAVEAQSVIGLRLARLAAGDAAALAEAQRMVTEKVLAAGEVQRQVVGALITGEVHMTPARAVAFYRRKVRANGRRLSRSARRRAG